MKRLVAVFAVAVIASGCATAAMPGVPAIGMESGYQAVRDATIEAVARVQREKTDLSMHHLCKSMSVEERDRLIANDPERAKSIAALCSNTAMPALLMPVRP